MVTMSTVNAATNAITATQAATTYYNGTLTTKMASGKVRTTTNFQNSYITSDGTLGIDEFTSVLYLAQSQFLLQTLLQMEKLEHILML